MTLDVMNVDNQAGGRRRRRRKSSKNVAEKAVHY